MAATASSSSARPDAKAQRYDRQLRLWASSGQTALEHASVLAVSGSATATQVLKNLVLPGIGSFAILDDKMTEVSDVGNNFFLTAESLGKPRAEQQVELLKELNDGVQGKAIVASLKDFMDASERPLADYSLVLACDTSAADSAALASRCWDLGIPMLIVRSVGFTGYARTQVKEAAFVETHPDSLVDLRLDVPFPALLEYTKSIDVQALDSMEHGHVPAVVIVIQALEEYKQKHNGNPPASFKERKELKELINARKRSLDDENYDEAIALIVKLAKPSSVPRDVAQLFEDPACLHLTAQSTPFWILLRAVKDFVQSDPHHLLPLTGSLPDMKATSAGYLKLQTLYRAKAQEDLAAVTENVKNILISLGLSPDSISATDVLTFVKHAAYVQVIRGISLNDEVAGRLSEGTKKPADRLQRELESDEDSTLPWLVAIRSAERFEMQTGRWPGQVGAEYEADAGALAALAKEVLAVYGWTGDVLPERLDSALQEINRAGNAQLPQITALMGGIVAQEAIKLITKQYVALNGNLIFDGVSSRTAVASF